MKKVHIGLDIGISSVGWAILDQKFKIIKHGVRLFPTVDNPKDGKLDNEVRREKRSMRRQKNRRRNLKLDFIKLLKKYDLIDLEIDLYDKNVQYHQTFCRKYLNPQNNLLNLRLEGLTKKLPFKDLISILYWYLSHRGYKYQIADEIASKEQENISKNYQQDFDANKLPVENQSQFFNKNHYYRCELNRLFSSQDYLKELKIILNKSSENKRFNDEYLTLFMRQRSFEIGPGPKKGYENLPLKNLSLISPYSRYYINPKTKKLECYANIWDKTIGKCTYFHDQNRAPKNSFTSEIFNLLNDLNNLTIGNFKLSYQQKLNCLKISFLTKNNSNKIIEFIINQFNIQSANDIKGWKQDKDRKPLFTYLTSVSLINKHLKKHNFPLLTFETIFNGKQFNFNQIDNIIDILTKTKIVEKRIEQLKSFNLPLILIESLAKESTSSKTHALSYKAMQQMIPILLETSNNQMQIAHQLNWKSFSQLNESTHRYLPKDWIDNLISTPSVKRSLRQTINLLNTIIKKEQNIKVENIVIEMARELNNAQEKKKITEMQKFMEKSNEVFKSKIEAFRQNYPNHHISHHTLAKLWLFEQQKGHDAYTGEILIFDQVILNPNYVEMDHIIPYSQCFDDSRNNKVLTLISNNSKKGQRTPFQWFGHDKNQYMKMVNKWKDWYSLEDNNNNRKIFASVKKLQYLTSELDYSNPENSIGFINRNLVDTRYITKEIYNLLNQFSKNVNQEHPLFNTKIKSINGKMTNYYRKLIERKKSGQLLKRPEGIIEGSFDSKTGLKQRIWHGHHAEDAVIICYIALIKPQLNKFIEKTLNNVDKSYLQDISRDWIISSQDFILTINNLRNELNTNVNNVKFSYMINKQTNTKLFKETLYSLRKENNIFYKVKKINLLDLSNEKLSEMFSDKYKYRILMKKDDSKTFEAIKNLYFQYQSEKFPFKVAAQNKPYFAVSIFNNKNNLVIRKIKTLRVIKESKDLNDIILRDSKSFYESLNWTSAHLFKNNNGLYRIIPINATVFDYKTKQYKSLYYEKLEQLNISINTNPLYVIYRGTLLTDNENNLYRVCGVKIKESCLELKRLDRKESLRNIWTLNKKLLNFKIVEVDYLGNIFQKYQFNSDKDLEPKPNELLVSQSQI